MTAKTAPLPAFVCPVCAKTYHAHPLAIVLCTHSGTPRRLAKPALAIKEQS